LLASSPLLYELHAANKVQELLYFTIFIYKYNPEIGHIHWLPTLGNVLRINLSRKGDDDTTTAMMMMMPITTEININEQMG